jgi:glutathione S-transferase
LKIDGPLDEHSIVPGWFCPNEKQAMRARHEASPGSLVGVSTMLRLYHYWSSVCSQKVRMCLAEKRLPWDSVHVDLFRFENFEPSYTRLNPKAVVPTLDHDGRILIESNVILEYLEDKFPEVRLRPEGPYECAMMRLWVYNSEEGAHWNVNVCSHNARHAKRLKAAGISADEILAAADRCPNPMIGLRLRRRVEVGVSEEEESEAYAKLDHLLGQMEERLAHGPWLAGHGYSLADIAMAPMINRIEVLPRPDMLSPERRPRLADWWQRVQARPAFQTAFSFKNPDVNDPVKR